MDSFTADAAPQGFGTVWSRMVRVVRRRGLAHTIGFVASQAVRMAYLRETHVWYALNLEADRRSVPLAAGFRLFRAGLEDLSLLAQLPTVGVHEASRRLQASADLWLVVEGSTVAFSCWTFHHRLPAIAARHGSIELPPHTVGLEDSVTGSAYRGRGLAPAAWSMVAAIVADDGIETMVTKIEENNLPCRRAIEKAGFRAVASMDLERIGGVSRIALRPYEGQGIGPYLAAQLDR